jgi:hypothetical protein
MFQDRAVRSLTLSRRKLHICYATTGKSGLQV